MPPWQTGKGTRRMLALLIETWYEESPPASAAQHMDRA